MMWYTHTHTRTHTMEYYSAKKEWNFAICSNMDGVGWHYAKWNKSDRERQILYAIIFMWNLKNNNKLANITKKKQIHRHREQTSGYQWGEKRGEVYNKLQGYTVQHGEYTI